MARAAWLGGLMALAILWGRCASAAGERASVDVFVSGAGGYHSYRIPSIILTRSGKLLAICEGRKNSRADDGDIDLVSRLSVDGGRTWQPQQLVHEEGGTERVTIGNPCPVVDQQTGTIWLPFCRNNRDVLITSSTDDGRTWAPPRTITESVKEPVWGWYATGPGVGIQMRAGPHAGRMVIPCDHGRTIAGKRVMFSHVIFSDDHGRTWALGGTVDRHTDECQVVELAEGELLINMRNYWGRDGGRPERAGMRAISRSKDGGKSWSPLEFDSALIEPVCQASLIAVPRPGRPGARLLVFSNPAATDARRNMTVRMSADEGKTWPLAVPVDEGPSAYSCLAALPDGRIGLLYERADYSRLTFTTVALEEAVPLP